MFVVFLCCYLAAGFKKMKRIKAFVNELMCDASDATMAAKSDRDHTFRFSYFSFSFRERWNAANVRRGEKAEEYEQNDSLIVVKTKKKTKKTKKLIQRPYLEQSA